MTLSRRAFLSTTGIAGLALATARCADPRDGASSGDLPVTPALYNTPVDTDRLATALKAIAARGV